MLKPPDEHSIVRNNQMEDQYNKKHGSIFREFNIGDEIFVQLHQINSWRWEEGTITKRIGNVDYYVETKDRFIQAHVNQLKHRHSLNLSFGIFIDLFEQDEQETI